MGVILPGREDSDWMQFRYLLTNLKHVGGAQLYRIVAQAFLMTGVFVLLGITTVKKWKGEASSGISLMNTIARGALFTASSVVGGFYEVFAPSLADGTAPAFAVSICWITMQVWLFAFPISLAIYGNLKKDVIHEDVVDFLMCLSCLLEVTVSEAWIAKARNEVTAFKVPSWMEIALQTGYEEDATN